MLLKYTLIHINRQLLKELQKNRKYIVFHFNKKRLPRETKAIITKAIISNMLQSLLLNCVRTSAVFVVRSFSPTTPLFNTFNMKSLSKWPEKHNHDNSPSFKIPRESNSPKISYKLFQCTQTVILTICGMRTKQTKKRNSPNLHRPQKVVYLCNNTTEKRFSIHSVWFGTFAREVNSSEKKFKYKKCIPSEKVSKRYKWKSRIVFEWKHTNLSYKPYKS